MQLPFMARLFADVPIVPMVMGHQRRDTVFALGAALAKAIGAWTKAHVLLVASSDLSHFHDANTAAAMDAVVIDHVARLDAEGLMRALEREPHHACGGGPIAAVLDAARRLGAANARVLKYSDSGDVTGDKSSVVGYMAAAVWADKQDSMVTETEQQQLLVLARQALQARVAGGHPPNVECTGPFALRCGAFVSIHSGRDLRGCLGRLTVDSPLGTTIAHLGGAVAHSDPRFPRVSPFELPFLQIEISLLTPVRPILSIVEIEVGRHGLIVERGRARGLLLPQVATEHSWDRETFLAQTCIKAGLPGDAWRTGAGMFVFEAHIFSERAMTQTH